MNQTATVSPRKIAANRQNAQRSTGPRTPEGKRRVRWNALQHGVLAAQVLLDPGESPESLEQFRRLLAQLRRDRRPRGALENMLVEKIAVCHWRLGRLLRSEAGTIRSGLDAAERRRQRNQERDLESTLAAAAAGQATAHQELQQTSWGLNLLLSLLGRAQDELCENPQLPPDSLKMLRACFGNPKWLSQEVLDEPNGLQNLRQALGVEAGYLRQEKRAEERKEAREWQARMASLSVPGKEDVQKIVRYENSIERNLQRALRQLERLQSQRSRRGDPGAPRKLRNKAKKGSRRRNKSI